MEEFRHTIDDMLEHLRGKIGYTLGSASAALKPPIESFVEEGKLTVRIELPGIDPKDITVNVVGDMLTIRASRQEEHETKKRDFLHREFRYGSIERLITLPQNVKAEDVKAGFSNGGFLEGSNPFRFKTFRFEPESIRVADCAGTRNRASLRKTV